MIKENIQDAVQKLLEQAESLTAQASDLQQMAAHLSGADGGASPFMVGLTILVLAVFLGYYVVWNVTPALHSPLMAVTNAVSSVIILGALIACGLPEMGAAKIFGFIAVTLASVNIFGGFIVSHRMLEMFNKKK